MAMRMPAFSLLALCLLLAGCAEKRWWIGRWVFDADYTQRQVVGQPEPGKPGSLIQNLAPLAMLPFAGMELTITDKEIITTRAGEGKARKYEVMERPSPTSVTLRIGDEVSTYTLQEGRISASLTDGLPIRAYFRRLE